MALDKKIWLVLYRNQALFDYLLISPDHVEKCEKAGEQQRDGKLVTIKLNEKGVDAYLASAFVDTIARSNAFRKITYKNLYTFCDNNILNINVAIFIKLLTPKYQFLDYKWNERINTMVSERLNIEYAMSWLSTLGGAFSALGDCFDDCAVIAGKISIEQFKLALQLGDPSLTARCKLYAALSMIQRNSFKYPKQIIQEVFSFAKEIKDVRLQRMCQGIWAKLQYQHYLKKQKKGNCKKNNAIK